jgi:hypothetical protein
VNRCCAAGGYPFRTKWDWNYRGCLIEEFAERYKERIGLLDSACRGDQEGPIKEPPREGY